MENTNMTPRKRKKRRRLRKPVKIGLMVIGLLACILLVWGIIKMVNAIRGTGGKEPVQTEESKTPDTSQDNSQNSSDTSSSGYNSKTGLTTYPDNGNKKITVMLDAGHGGTDPGNVMTDIETGEQYLEKDINLKLVKLIQRKLEATNPNLEVILTRNNDNITYTTEEDDLNWRTEMQSSLDGGETADFFISLHANANQFDPSLIGYNFFIKPDDEAMRGMAELMAKYFNKQDWSENNGIVTMKERALQVIAFSPTHAMLVEVGYMTNDDELTKLLDTKELDKIANAIAASISDYIMQNPDAVNTPSPALTPEDLDPDAPKDIHDSEQSADDPQAQSSSSDMTDGYNGTVELDGSSSNSQQTDPALDLNGSPVQ